MCKLRLYCPEPPEDDPDAAAEALADVNDALHEIAGVAQTDVLRDVVTGRITLTEIAGATGLHVGNVGRRYRTYLRKLRGPLASLRMWLALRRDGGFTFNPRTGHFVRRDAWAVSRVGYGAAFPQDPTVGDVAAYLRAHEEAWSDDRLYVGGWRDDDAPGGPLHFLDATELVPGRETTQAIELAKANGQRSIFHLLTGRSLYLRDDEDDAQSDGLLPKAA